LNKFQKIIVEKELYGTWIVTGPKGETTFSKKEVKFIFDALKRANRANLFLELMDTHSWGISSNKYTLEAIMDLIEKTKDENNTNNAWHSLQKLYMILQGGWIVIINSKVPCLCAECITRNLKLFPQIPQMIKMRKTFKENVNERPQYLFDPLLLRVEEHKSRKGVFAEKAKASSKVINVK